jgi:hypothetical protein
MENITGGVEALNTMRYSIIGTMLVITCLFGLCMSAAAAEEEPITQSNASIKLTDVQQSELANLHKDILMKKGQLIAKYVEYGIISEVKGKKIMEHMNNHYRKLEANGFIPSHDKHRGREHMKREMKMD